MLAGRTRTPNSDAHFLEDLVEVTGGQFVTGSDSSDHAGKARENAIQCCRDIARQVVRHAANVSGRGARVNDTPSPMSNLASQFAIRRSRYAERRALVSTKRYPLIPYVIVAAILPCMMAPMAK